MLLFFVCLARLCEGKANSDIAGRPSINGKVAEPKRDSQPIRLPIIDGTDIRFLRFYTLEGPSKSNAGPFVQDNQGFVWFGTPYGLNRFDGYSFRVFTHIPSNPTSISGSFINAIFKDRAGALWIGCNQFLNKFNSETEDFTRFPIPYVFDISQDATGILWLSTPTGLYSLDPTSKNIRHYSHDSNDPESLESNDIKSSGEDREGGFWVATSEGLDAFDRSTGKVTFHIPTKEASYPLSFYEDRLGVFWIYHVSGDPLAVFDRKKKILTEYSFQDIHSSRLALTGVTKMLEDQDGVLWLATNGSGLLKLDREHHRFIRYRHKIGDPESLAQNSVRDLFADREGVIWAGLGGYGLTRFRSRPLPFKSYRRDFGNPADRDEPFVGAIYEDHDGILWIGTHSALHRIDRNHGKVQEFRLSKHAEGTDAITICEDRVGYLWIGTYGHGLFRFDPRTHQIRGFRHNPADPYSLSNDIVPRVFLDHNGTLWAATHDGLNRFDAATGQFKTYRMESQGIHPYYLGEAEDRKGMLWLGTESSGLLRFDPNTGALTIYQHESNRPDSLSDNRVNSIHFDQSGTMWVGTQEALNRFDDHTGTFTSYTRRDGLPGSVVSCILEDDHGYLWVSTDNGIAKFDPKTGNTKRYSTADGLPGPDLTGWGTCFQSSQGEMYFGGFSGATAFFPQAVAANSYIPPVALTDFRLSGIEIFASPASPLKKTINHTEEITLSHEQNRFSIGFSALSYLNPAANQYRYKLEPLETGWNEVGSDERFATYTTLPAGDYMFRVEGATSGGPWNVPGATLRINILPAWWDTWWFRLTYVVVAFLVAAIIYTFRVRRLRLERERNDKLRHAQADLAHMSRVSTMGELSASLAHEIKQPITAAALDATTCVRWLAEEPPNAAEARTAAARVVKDVTRAADIIGRVVRLFKKDVPEREPVDLMDLIREMANLLQSEAERHGVSINIELTTGLPHTTGDRVGLQQALMNLMLNGVEAIRETGKGGVLTVKAWHTDGKLAVSVADTGAGVQPGKEQEIFNTFFTTKPKGTGMGLAISRSIIESHGGVLWLTKNDPHGAVFQFTLPTKF